MKRRYGILILSLALIPLAGLGKPLFVAGTYEKGANITTPRPATSKYLKTVVAGFDVAKEGAAYKLFIDVVQKRDKALYLKMEFEDPADSKTPFVEEGPLASDKDTITACSKAVKGLKIYSDYAVKVMLFDAKDAKEPIDVLKQTVRSYVDTQGKEVKLYKGLRKGSKQ